MFDTIDTIRRATLSDLIEAFKPTTDNTNDVEAYRLIKVFLMANSSKEASGMVELLLDCASVFVTAELYLETIGYDFKARPVNVVEYARAGAFKRFVSMLEDAVNEVDGDAFNWININVGLGNKIFERLEGLANVYAERKH